MRKLCKETGGMAPSRDQLESLMVDVPGFTAYRCRPDRDWTMVYMSNETLAGYPAGDFIGSALRSFRSVIHEDDVDHVERSVGDALAARLPWDIEYRLRHREGGICWVHEKGRGVLDEEGRPLFLDGFIFDITDRKQAGETLRENERRFRELADSLPEPVFETDLQGTLTFANRQAFVFFGYTREEFEAGLNVLDMIDRHDHERALANVQKVLHGENIGSSEYVVNKNDGSRCPVMIHSTAIIREGKPVGLRGFLVDMSHRKQAEEERIALERRLAHASKMESIGTLAGGIAHDFNNILMAIQGNASLVMLDLVPANPHYTRMKYIQDQVERASDLTAQLLGYAMGGHYDVKPADVNEILEKSAILFGNTRKDITMYRHYAADQCVAMVDRTQMEQVFMHCLMNAGHAMPAGGGIYLETMIVDFREDETTPGDLSPGPYVRVAITDTGVGMDERTKQRLFDPFFTTKGMGRGSGLGLASVYGIVKGHGGTIDVESEPGRGTTFNLYIPVSGDVSIAEKKSRAGERSNTRGQRSAVPGDVPGHG